MKKYENKSIKIFLRQKNIEISLHITRAIRSYRICDGKNVPKMAATVRGWHIAYVTSRMTPRKAKTQRDSLEKVG